MLSSSAVKVQELVDADRGAKNLKIINNTPYVSEIILSLSSYGFNVRYGNNTSIKQELDTASENNPFLEKPEVIIGPMAVLGTISETQKRILKNTLSETLSEDFRVVSNERFEEAQEQAFQELDYEECTEDQCIMLIQEMLQVEYFYKLEIIKENDNYQLSLQVNTLDGKLTKNSFCEKCNSISLTKTVTNLSTKLIDSLKENKVLKIHKSKIKENIVQEKWGIDLSTSDHPYQCALTEYNIHNFTLTLFDLNSNQIVLVLKQTGSDGPCTTIKPVFDTLASKLSEVW